MKIEQLIREKVSFLSAGQKKSHFLNSGATACHFTLQNWII